MRYINQDKKQINISKLVRETIDAMPIGTKFYGWELRNLCVRGNPEIENAYVETFIKSMRMYRRASVVCISHSRSQYMKVEPHVISGGN